MGEDGVTVEDRSVARYRPPGWVGGIAHDTPGAAEFTALLDTLRRLQAAVAATAPPAIELSDLTDMLRYVAERLESHHVPERDRFASGSAAAGPGHPLLVPYVVREVGEHTLRATVEFSDFHLGGNGAAHGGAISLLFDDLLGTFVGVKGPPRSRTASLKVNYRRIAPINTPLRVEATMERVEGRKSWVTGTLHDGDDLLANAEALFVQLKPDQP